MADVSERVARLKQRIREIAPEVSAERALLFTRAYQESEGDPFIVRRAKAIAKCLLEMEIVIAEDELIVGNRSPKPRSGVVSPEMAVDWIEAELDTLPLRPQDKFLVSHDTKQTLRDEVLPYWKGKTLKDLIFAVLPDETLQAWQDRVFHLNQTDKGQGHIIPDYESVLTHGFDGLLEQVRGLWESKAAQNPETALFYKAAMIVLEAASQFGLRYAREARRQAALMPKTDSSEASRRAAELLAIAAICEQVPKNPAGSFREAIQAIWLTHIILQVESNASSISFGRLDQYLLPYFQNDINSGKISRQEAQDLLDCLWIKTNEIVAIRSAESARYFAGFPINPCITIGGTDLRGGDAANELTFMCLESTCHIRLPQPNIALRVHSKIDERVLFKAAEVVRLGIGIPHFYNDEVTTPALMAEGVSLEDARDYAIVGCVEVSVPGKTYGLHDIALFNLVRCLEITLREADQKDTLKALSEWEKLREQVRLTMVFYIEQMARGCNIVEWAHACQAPTPLLSVLVKNCLPKGQDITGGGALYNFSGVQLIGLANMADSMAALQWAAFPAKDNPRIPLTNLWQALSQNFENLEPLRQMLLNQAPKYGNDCEAVDSIAREWADLYCREVARYTNNRGGHFTSGMYTISSHVPLGQDVGATPDGRKAGEPLADGGLSPVRGRDVNGPTAVLRTVSKVDQMKAANGSLLNVKFLPAALEPPQGAKRFVQYIRAWMLLKVMQIQFNVISSETLRKAQERPEEYRNLVVRVAGYSAFFVDLNNKLQEDIIARTAHGL